MSFIKLKSADKIGGFLHFMWLFRRALPLCRTFVRRRVGKSRLLHLNDSAPSRVFRFQKGLFLKSPFCAVWSAELHEYGVFLFAKLFLLRLFAQKKKRTMALCLYTSGVTFFKKSHSSTTKPLPIFHKLRYNGYKDKNRERRIYDLLLYRTSKHSSRAYEGAAVSA